MPRIRADRRSTCMLFLLSFSVALLSSVASIYYLAGARYISTLDLFFARMRSAISSFLLPLLASFALASNGRRQSNTQSNNTPYAVKIPPLTTPWTDNVGRNAWPEYPRPQLQRSEWLNLNGIWTYENASGLDAVNSPPHSQKLPNEVLVPSCLESGLSGEVNI